MNKKEEIKNRIDLINKGEVPEGYKKNRGYIIPNTWSILSAGSIFKNLSIKNTENLEKNVLSVTQDRGVVPREYVGIDIKYNEESLNTYKKIQKCNFIISLRSFQGGIEYSKYDGIVSPAYTVLKNILPINNYYYITYLKTEDFIKRLNTAVYGIRDGKQISYNDFSTIPIIYPPKQEQEKIAEILCCCDKVIELKEKLLDEKTKRKQYVMNKLLAINMGKPYILGQIGTTYTGLSGKNKDDFGFGSKFIPYTNIFANIFVNIDDLEYVNIKESESQSKVKYGDIFFTTSSECPEEVGMASVLLDNIEDLYLNSFCFGYRLNNFDILLPEYAGYLFRNNSFRSILNKLAQGMTRFNLSKNELMKETIYIPDIKTQKYCVDIFNNLDNELNLIKKELEQYKKLKKSLAQLLLTGIVRTV